MDFELRWNRQGICLPVGLWTFMVDLRIVYVIQPLCYC